MQSLLACPAFQIFAMFSGVSFSNNSSFTSLSNVYRKGRVWIRLHKWTCQKSLVTGADESYGNWDLAAMVAADAFLVVSAAATLGATFLGWAALRFLAASSLIFCFNCSTVNPSLSTVCQSKDRLHSLQWCLPLGNLLDLLSILDFEISRLGSRSSVKSTMAYAVFN